MISATIFRDLHRYNYLITKIKTSFETNCKIIEIKFKNKSNKKEILTQYSKLKTPDKAFIRDMQGLLSLQAIEVMEKSDSEYIFSPNLEWPTEITESDFHKRIKDLPKAKTHSFLRYH
jgi:hypothetical protein